MSCRPQQNDGRPAAVPDNLNTIIVIPARMASGRLPGKPLADIHGVPMILRVWRQAVAAGCGAVLVAAAESAIAQVIRRAGGDAIVTEAGLPSGSDRVHQALALRDSRQRWRYVVNLQGDLPTADPDMIRGCLTPLRDGLAAIASPVARITDEREIADPNVVKAMADFGDGTVALARDFVRRPPPAALPPFWHHIGIYAYTRQALERFVRLPVSPGERRHRLEQLRALENGLDIAVFQVAQAPPGVDTPQDLEKVRSYFKGRMNDKAER